MISNHKIDGVEKFAILFGKMSSKKSLFSTEKKKFCCPVLQAKMDTNGVEIVRRPSKASKLTKSQREGVL